MPDPDPVIDGLFDLCDKVAVIGPSKMRKSFFVTQLAVCLARENAKTFLSFSIPKRRKVLLVQLEIKDLHQQRRLHQLCCGLFIEHRELSQNLYVLNGRGVGIKPAMLLKPAKELGIEVIIVDPLYKILEGDENSAKDMKPALAEFDRLVEETGAAVLYVHHDRKGASGDLDIRDRGSGSNVLGRDYDACLTLTPHSDVTNAVVLESLLRNYPSAEPQVIEWERMIFQESDHVALVETSQRRKQKKNSASIEDFLGGARDLLRKNGLMVIEVFREEIRALGASRDLSRAVVSKIQQMSDVYIVPHKRGSQKLIGLRKGAATSDGDTPHTVGNIVGEDGGGGSAIF